MLFHSSSFSAFLGLSTISNVASRDGSILDLRLISHQHWKHQSILQKALSQKNGLAFFTNWPNEIGISRGFQNAHNPRHNPLDAEASRIQRYTALQMYIVSLARRATFLKDRCVSIRKVRAVVKPRASKSINILDACSFWKPRGEVSLCFLNAPQSARSEHRVTVYADQSS